MDANIAPGCRKFDAGNEARPPGRGVDPLESRQRVVIRYGQHIDTRFGGMLQQGRGFQCPIGRAAV